MKDSPPAPIFKIISYGMRGHTCLEGHTVHVPRVDRLGVSAQWLVVVPRTGRLSIFPMPTASKACSQFISVWGGQAFSPLGAGLDSTEGYFCWTVSCTPMRSTSIPYWIPAR